jgi:hypothetical protein
MFKDYERPAVAVKNYLNVFKTARRDTPGHGLRERRFSAG